jgi:hypothetical protein
VGVYLGANLLVFLLSSVFLWLKVLSQSREQHVRIRQNTRKYRNFPNKKVYTRHILQLTIPARFKDVVKPFLNKDLKVETKQVGDNLVIKAKIANTYKATDG